MFFLFFFKFLLHIFWSSSLYTHWHSTVSIIFNFLAFISLLKFFLVDFFQNVFYLILFVFFDCFSVFFMISVYCHWYSIVIITSFFVFFSVSSDIFDSSFFSNTTDVKKTAKLLCFQVFLRNWCRLHPLIWESHYTFFSKFFLFLRFSRSLLFRVFFVRFSVSLFLHFFHQFCVLPLL